MSSHGLPEPYGRSSAYPSASGTPRPGRHHQQGASLNRPTFYDRFRSCLALPAMPASVATARMHTRDMLLRWHLTTISDDAGLVVTELLTNAIRRPTPSRPSPATRTSTTASKSSASACTT